MTTYNDLQPSIVKDIPFFNIGAQDVCSLESNWTGIIGKEGTLERGMKRLGPLFRMTSVHCRQYYVVLSQGCVYIFHDESSRSLKKSFSLKHYKRLQRNFNTPFSFHMLPSSDTGKIYNFRCRTETERLDWMRALYISLLCVHNQPVPRHVKSIGRKEEYDLTESEIVTSASTPDSKVYEVDDDSSDDDDDRYDKPEEVAELARTKNKYERDPTLPKSDSKQQHCAGSSVKKNQRKFPNGSVKTDISEQKSLESHNSKNDNDNLEKCVDAARSITTQNRPKVAPKPVKTRPPSVSSIKPLSSNTPSGTSLSSQSSKPSISENTKEQEMYMNTTVFHPDYVNPDPKVDPSDEYMFDGDKYDTGRVLHLKPKGTFLIRPSSEPDKKVLVVMTNLNMTSYKIHPKGPKLCIEINEQFDTISQLVEHYKKHNLPNNSITLGQGYNEVAEVDSDDYEPVEKPLK